MLVPAIQPGIEESDDLSCVGIDRGQIRAFVKITTVTRQGEVVCVSCTLVLPRNDVFDLK
jgi:hypothetical protein